MQHNSRAETCGWELIWGSQWTGYHKSWWRLEKQSLPPLLPSRDLGSLYLFVPSLALPGSYGIYWAGFKFGFGRSILCDVTARRDRGEVGDQPPPVPMGSRHENFSVLKPRKSQASRDQLAILGGRERGNVVFQTQHGIFTQKPTLLH